MNKMEFIKYCNDEISYAKKKKKQVKILMQNQLNPPHQLQTKLLQLISIFKRTKKKKKLCLSSFSITHHRIQNSLQKKKKSSREIQKNVTLDETYECQKVSATKKIHTLSPKRRKKKSERWVQRIDNIFSKEFMLLDLHITANIKHKEKKMLRQTLYTFRNIFYPNL